MQTSHSKTAAKNILFSTVAVLVFFILLESILHVSGYQPKIRFRSFELPYWFGNFDPVILEEYKKHVAELGFVNEDAYAYQPDEVLGYILKPGIQKTIRNYSASFLVDKMPEWNLISNASGFRTGKNLLPPTGARGTVHVLGDSSSFGWGVDYEQTYGFIFTEKLNSAGRKGDYNLLNHSMPGFSSHHGRLLLERLESIKSGDWVLISFGWNDSYFAGDTDRSRWEKRRSVPGQLRTRLNRFLFYQWLKSFWLGGEAIEEHDLAKVGQRVPLQEYRENLKAIIEGVKGRGAKPVLLSICNFDAYPQAIRTVSENMSVPFFDFPKQVLPFLEQVPNLFGDQFVTYFDVYGNLMEEEPSLMVVFPDYCHPNSIGHQLLGGLVFDAVKNELGLGTKPS